MMKSDPVLDNAVTGNDLHSPAIWLYPKKEIDVEVTLKFQRRAI